MHFANPMTAKSQVRADSTRFQGGLAPAPDPSRERLDRSAAVYVASSWRCPTQQAVVAAIRAAGFDAYDFRNPPKATGFSWRQVGGTGPEVQKGHDYESAANYLRMVAHPTAVAGFVSDFDAMQAADIFVLVLPCGKSAHLELGWAGGAGKRTAVLLEDPMEPELMYRMVDFLALNLDELLDWLGQ